jgi:hypothetical protein
MQSTAALVAIAMPPQAISRALTPGRRPAPGQPRLCSSRRDPVIVRPSGRSADGNVQTGAIIALSAIAYRNSVPTPTKPL